MVNPHQRYRIETELISALLLAIMILIIYQQVRCNGYIDFDDNKYIVENANLHKGLSFQSVKWALTSCDIDYWHPLTWVSHMIDFSLFGFNAAMHHMVNVLFHLLNAILLFLFLFRGTGFAGKSALVAGLFAVHPLNVESVAWLAERKNVLSTFFWMLCLISYCHYTKRPGWVRYLSTLFLFCLGLMCKPTVVTLPFILFILDYWPLTRFQFSFINGWKIVTKGSIRLPVLVLEKVPFIIISAAVVAFFILQIQNVSDAPSLSPALKSSNALISYVTYLGKAAWPANLSIFYPYPESVPVLRVLAATFFLLFVTFFMIKMAVSKPYMIVGWLWYLGTLIPVLGIVQNGLWPAVADRFVYVPMIGILIITVWGISDGLKIRWINTKICVGVAISMIFGLLIMTSAAQVRNWKNSKTIFEHAVNVTKNNWLAHNQLGTILAREDDLDQAVLHLSKAVMLKSDSTLPLFNLAGVYKEKGDSDTAMYYYRQLLKIKPDHSDARNNIGVLLYEKGDLPNAERQYKVAIAANPQNAKAHCNFANLLSEQGNLDEAMLHYLKAIRIDAHDADFQYNLGGVLLKQKRRKEAMFRFSEAIKINPGYAPAYYQIGLLFMYLGDQRSARIFFEKTIQLDRHFTKAKDYLDQLNQ
jgi:protein O-mannosyl-transferase